MQKIIIREALYFPTSIFVLVEVGFFNQRVFYTKLEYLQPDGHYYSTKELKWGVHILIPLLVSHLKEKEMKNKLFMTYFCLNKFGSRCCSIKNIKFVLLSFSQILMIVL